MKKCNKKYLLLSSDDLSKEIKSMQDELKLRLKLKGISVKDYTSRNK